MTLACVPASTYPLGETEVTVTCNDGLEDTVGDCTIAVVDTTPPSIECNAPVTMTPRDAPISMVAEGDDNCDAEASIEIVGFDCFAFTGAGKRIDKTESCVVDVAGDSATILDSGGVGATITWTVRATDSSGNTSQGLCQVQVVHPIRGI